MIRFILIFVFFWVLTAAMSFGLIGSFALAIGRLRG